MSPEARADLIGFTVSISFILTLLVILPYLKGAL